MSDARDAPGRDLPSPLRVVAWLFIVVGVYAIGESILAMTDGTFALDLGMLFPLVGYGLLQRKALARTCALGVAWIYAVGIPVAALVSGILWAQGNGTLRVEMLGPDAIWNAVGATTATAMVASTVAAGVMVFLAAWTIQVLRRDDIRRLFDEAQTSPSVSANSS